MFCKNREALDCETRIKNYQLSDITPNTLIQAQNHPKIGQSPHLALGIKMIR